MLLKAYETSADAEKAKVLAKILTEITLSIN
jgi:hypothetical protein